MTTNNYSRYRKNFTPEDWLWMEEVFQTIAELEHSRPFDFCREKDELCQTLGMSYAQFDKFFKDWKLQEAILGGEQK